MNDVPIPPGWTVEESGPGPAHHAVRDPADPGTPRLASHGEHAPGTSMRRWLDEVVAGLARTMDDWLLIDAGPAPVAGTRGFRVLGCSAPPGAPARVHESWCTVRDGHRYTLTLTARVRDYDAVTDAVSGAVRDWRPAPEDAA